MYLPALFGHLVRHRCKQTRFFFQITFWQTLPQRMVSMFSYTAYVINWNTVILFTHKIVTYIISFLSKDKGEVGDIQCSCENPYGCENNTCWGRICFYSSIHGRVSRGCFSTGEQCYVPDVPGVYTKCCYMNFCNANLSMPEITGKPFFFLNFQLRKLSYSF